MGTTTTDTIVIQYKVDLSNLEAGYEKIEQDQKSITVTGQKSMQTLKTGADQAGQATQQVTKNTSLLKDKLSEIGNNLPFANQAKEVLSLGSAITGLGGGAQKASSGFQILKLAIAGTGIGLLVIAIVSLITYFKRTDEGAAKLTGVFSSFGAAADLVTGFIVGLGEGVFKAFTSVDNFKNGLSALGDFILNNTINRFKAFGVYLDAISLALSGDFTGAAKKALDASIQLGTGVVGATDKITAFAEKAAIAAAAAFEWEQRMDALEDKIRGDSTLIAQNDAAITKLIIASKNKFIQDEKSLALLGQASQLEKQNLAITLQNETAKLKLIQERNKRESDSINQDKKAGETRRSINDDLSQEEVDQINKIIGIQQQSDNLLEKINNRRDAKLEEIFQNQVKRISQQEELQGNAAKAEYLAGITSEEQLEEALYNIKLEGLQKQKELLVTESRDIVDIDKSILDLELSNKNANDKKIADANAKAVAQYKKDSDEKVKAGIAAQKSAFAALDAALTKEEKAQSDHQNKIKQIASSGLDVLHTLSSGLYNDLAQKRQNDLNAELLKTQKQNDAAQTGLQNRLDKGLISQDQYNQQKILLDNKQARKEADIKTQQFNANKKAQLINIAIDTAAAIVKTIATLGIPAGLAAAAIAGALGIAQAAVVQAQATPKYFAKGKIDIDGPGTSTSDSIDAKLSRGESVMTATETAEHKGALLAMRNRKYNEHVYKNHILPALEKQQRDNMSRRQAKEMQVQDVMNFIASNSTDTSRVEYYLKKNKDVGIKNYDQIAKSIAKELSKNKPLYR